ncbi:MAG TPA: hypothetical protein VGH80_07145 [Xanthomonadaceae bacterium]|jgi:hypothetical protein
MATNEHPADNSAFIEQHAAPGRIGLCGGQQWLNKLIRKAQGPLTADGHRSMWSHAFIFSERRIDGHWWVIESDLDMRTKHVRLGVQENRATRYFDAEQCPNIAVLDFGLDAAQTLKVQQAALDTLSGLSTYSLGELVGTLLSLHSRRLRGRENLLSKEGALYCSAFVQHCYEAVGIRFQPGIHGKNIAPHDIETSPVAHTMHSLVRDTVTNPKPRTRYRLKQSAT